VFRKITNGFRTEWGAKLYAAEVAGGRAKEPARRRDLAAPQQGPHLLQMRRRTLEFESPRLIGLDEGPAAFPQTLDSHRGMEPIQDMPHRSICRAPNGFGKRWVTVTEDDDVASWQPASHFHRGANNFMPRAGSVSASRRNAPAAGSSSRRGPLHRRRLRLACSKIANDRVSHNNPRRKGRRRHRLERTRRGHGQKKWP